ncbi:MAG: oligopeptidase [Paenibacillus dendritiformis]|uniref:oligopeptidase n=1 Tax=Paenibacillus dendritiformis TaxID=130049 RepID=UPI001BCC169D|nr:oligopeptidase [Paenibacillus dendritiformis]MDU5144621.1 oligopeptidase [Paenibacillus dendritiformis]
MKVPHRNGRPGMPDQVELMSVPRMRGPHATHSSSPLARERAARMQARARPGGGRMSIRSYNGAPSGLPEGYPELSGYAPYPQTPIVPFNAVAETPIETAVQPDKKLLGNFSMGDLKSMIDRLGGVDGIVETMGKVQKIMSSVQQIMPVAKMFMGTLLPGKGGGKKLSTADDGDYEAAPRRRRRYSGGSPRSGSGNRRRSADRRTGSASRRKR